MSVTCLRVDVTGTLTDTGALDELIARGSHVGLVMGGCSVMCIRIVLGGVVIV